MRIIREVAPQMKTCVERCALEFESSLLEIFGRALNRAECERMARECDPCKPQFCAVATLLKKRAPLSEGEAAALAK